MDACQRAMEHLTASGILTYKPGVATGKCRAPYVVVRGGGAYARGMSGAAGIGYRTVTLYCFVPRVGGDLPAFVAEVRQAMRGLKSQLRPTGNEGIEMLEEDLTRAVNRWSIKHCVRFCKEEVWQTRKLCRFRWRTSPAWNW